MVPLTIDRIGRDPVIGSIGTVGIDE